VAADTPGRHSAFVFYNCFLMSLRFVIAVLLSIAAISHAAAQSPEAYAVPKTAYGDPDLQGVWAADFLTTLERSEGFDHLVASPEQAQSLVEAIRTNLAGADIDPDAYLHDISQLANVKGEYRTSVIVEPEDGRLPLTQAGLDLVAWSRNRDATAFDEAAQRPLVERCLESYGFPPMRSIPYLIPRQIFQTPGQFLMVTEDPVGLRIIHLDGEAPPESVRSLEGHSIGHWEGETLVVRTTNLRADDPARFVGGGRPLLHSRNAEIEERFTRVSEKELFYRYTVYDDELYSQPWSGEFSLALWDDPIFEYALPRGEPQHGEHPAWWTIRERQPHGGGAVAAETTSHPAV
jgi:hypothetical protein